jgi:TonB family protein
VSAIRMKKIVVVLIGAVALLIGTTMSAPAAHTQDTIGGRKVKSKATPVYPELARKMNISGTVKVEVVITPKGDVKSAKATGGHPLLIDAAVDAAKRYKFEAASDETTTTIPFNFSISQ